MSEEPPLAATVGPLLDGLVGALQLSYVMARLTTLGGAPPIEVVQVSASTQEIAADELAFVVARIGLHGELGILVAAGRGGTPSLEKHHIDLAAAQVALSLAHERERQLRLLVDTIPALVWRGTADGDLDFLNHRAVEYLGHTAQDLSKGRWLDVIHPDHQDAAVRRWMQAVSSGASYEDIYRLRRADGQFRWTRSIGEPLRDAEGRIVQWYGVIIDVEERKRIEEDLRRSEAFLAQAQKLTLTGSVWWDVATGDLVWSDEIYRMLEVPGTTTPSVELGFSRVHPDDVLLVRESVERAAGQGVDMDFESRLLMPDGSVKHAHVVLQNIAPHPGAPIFVGAITDVTARIQADDALHRARTELARVARLATANTLTGLITHEVNQPLTGIVTNAGTCLRMLNADPPDVAGARETARRLMRDGNRAVDVIAGLRTLFTRKDFTLEPLDLNAATRDVISLITNELKRERVLLLAELAEDLPAVAGDRVQIQQVVLNLLRNAADAMAGIDDRPRHVAVTTGRHGHLVRLSVRDAGPGFDPQSLDKLFDAFYTTKSDGMGMGLSVSRSIIETHHGRLWAELNDGPGATFSFEIPAIS